MKLRGMQPEMLRDSNRGAASASRCSSRAPQPLPRMSKLLRLGSGSDASAPEGSKAAPGRAL